MHGTGPLPKSGDHWPRNVCCLIPNEGGEQTCQETIQGTLFFCCFTDLLKTWEISLIGLQVRVRYNGRVLSFSPS